MKNPKKYKAFTLLELLVSIVILGIVMSSFPFIFQTMTNSSKLVMKEEVFFQEFTLLSIINSRYFDENNTIGENFYKDLNATGGDSELYNNYSSTYAGKTSRKGKTEFNNNLLRSGDANTTSPIGLDTGENASDISTFDDIDDFNGYSETVSDYTIHVQVKYISDSATYNGTNLSKISDFEFNYSTNTPGSNIKLITIWASVGDTNITLKYPTSNIGASKYLSLEEITR